MKILFYLFIFIFSLSFGYSEDFNSKGTNYGEATIAKYFASEQWPYISHFLLKKILPNLQEIEGEKILDGGCGPGIWIVPLASKGAMVYAIDIQEKMLEEAKKRVKDANLLNQVTFQVADIAHLPYQDNFFDKSLSINVVCNVPHANVDNHFLEISRTLKEGGIAIVVIPTSLDVVFTNDTKNKSIVMQQIKEVLARLPKYPKSSEIKSMLSLLEDVLSATFILDNNGYLILVTDKSQLNEGQEIWRKLPDITIPNRYHSLAIIHQAIKNAKLSIEKIEYSKFTSEEERVSHNKSISHATRKLGYEYVENPIFCIYYLKKCAELRLDYELLDSEETVLDLMEETHTEENISQTRELVSVAIKEEAKEDY